MFDDMESSWEDLPDILLEDIFVLLEPRHRHEASQVCIRWYETFYAPRVWEHFTLKGNILKKRRYYAHKGYQRETCPRKTQICLHRVGYLFKKITITPIHDFQHVYEFIRILRAYLGYFDEFPMPLLRTFHFTFTCETRGITGVILHGTGGKMMEELRHLLHNMKLLKDLKLNNLMLDCAEVEGLFEAIAYNCSDTLETMEILNFTKVPYPILDITLFNNIHTLRTSPQHLDDEVIVILASSSVCSLHIIQGRYTCNTDSVSDDAWRLVKQMAPYFRVTLEVRGHTKTSDTSTPRASKSHHLRFAKFKIPSRDGRVVSTLLPRHSWILRTKATPAHARSSHFPRPRRCRVSDVSQKLSKTTYTHHQRENIHSNGRFDRKK